jgi:small-conductance mechanosensitive channel
MNRRLKKRFDELGIEIPFPQRTMHLAGSPPQEPPRQA